MYSLQLLSNFSDSYYPNLSSSYYDFKSMKRSAICCNFTNKTKTKSIIFVLYLKWPLFWIALLLMKSIYTSVRKNQAPLVLVGQIHSNEAFLSTSFPGNLWRNPIDAAKIHQKVSFSPTIKTKPCFTLFP